MQYMIRCGEIQKNFHLFHSSYIQSIGVILTPKGKFGSKEEKKNKSTTSFELLAKFQSHNIGTIPSFEPKFCKSKVKEP